MPDTVNDEPRDVRVPFMASRSEVDEIDDWRFRNRVRTRADAIRMLVKRGLAAPQEAEQETARE